MRAIQESPLNSYIHETNYPFHTRRISRPMWDNLSQEKRNSLINFGGHSLTSKSTTPRQSKSDLKSDIGPFQNELLNLGNCTPVDSAL